VVRWIGLAQILRNRGARSDLTKQDLVHSKSATFDKVAARKSLYVRTVVACAKMGLSRRVLCFVSSTASCYNGQALA
jgi:hypothetical protein